MTYTINAAQVCEAFSDAAIGMALVHLNGQYLQVNRKMCKITRYSETELLATSCQRIIHPDDRELFHDHVHKIMSGEIDKFHLETRYLQKGGGVIWTNMTVSLAKDLPLNAKYLFTQVQEITARKKAEQEWHQYVDRFTKLQQSEKYLELLNEITHTAISVQDFDEMLKVMADRLGELFAADGCFITLWDENSEEAQPAAACGPFHETYRSSPPEAKERTMTSSVLKARKALVAENVHDSPFISPKIAALFPACSLLGLPLIANGQKLGAALIAYQKPHHFTEQEIARGEQAAGQIALAISKALLLDSERRRRQEAETLRTVSNALVSTLELDQVLDLILDQLALVIDYDSAALMLREGDHVRVVTGRGFKNPDQFLGKHFLTKELPFQDILDSQRAVCLKNPGENSRLKDWGWNKNIRSWMALPMWAPGELIGFMTLDSYQPDVYGETEAALVQPYANQAAQAIENARRFDWVQRQALTDDLTGLYNRRGLFQLGKREVERAHRFERPLTAIMLDIDHFKQVNDRYGHYIGDQVLCEIARRCIELLRQVDLLGRYGGEEFAILLPETEIKTAMEVAERIRRFIADEPVETGRGALSITISLGVAQLTNDTTELARLLDAADTAMYTAKQAGRNCVREYKK